MNRFEPHLFDIYLAKSLSYFWNLIQGFDATFLEVDGGFGGLEDVGIRGKNAF